MKYNIKTKIFIIYVLYKTSYNMKTKIFIIYVLYKHI